MGGSFYIHTFFHKGVHRATQVAAHQGSEIHLHSTQVGRKGGEEGLESISNNGRVLVNELIRTKQENADLPQGVGERGNRRKRREGGEVVVPQAPVK